MTYYTTMKTKQTIICVVAGSTILLLFLAIVLFGSFEDDISFQFLDKHEPTEHISFSNRGYSGEILRYNFQADYDTFAEEAKAELSAKGFEDLTPVNGAELRYRRQSIGGVSYAIVRKNHNNKEPINSSIHVEIQRHNPENIKTYWAGLKAWYWSRGKP